MNFGNTNANKTGKTFSVTGLTTLDGNLTILGGSGNNSFNVNVGTIDGNITFSSGLLDDSGGRSTIEITTSLIGNICTDSDLGRKGTQANGDSNGIASADNGVKINFTGGATMTGSILGRGSGYDSLKRIVTFQGAQSDTTVLTGSIISYGTNAKTGIDFDETAGNHVAFTNGNMQGGIVATTGIGMLPKKGYNNITFASANTQTLTGGILATDSSNHGLSHQATNTLNINENTTLKIISSSDDNSLTVSDPNASNAINQTVGATFTLTEGSIIAQGYGINKINLAENSTLTLNDGKGEIKTENTGGNGAQSIIVFNGQNGTIQGNITTNTGSSSITFNKTGIINGNITTSGGSATISIANSASGAIVGSIIANGGTNSITTNNSASTSAFSVTSVTASGGQNIFSLRNTDQNNISTNTLTLTSMTAESSNNYISNDTNVSNFTSSWTLATCKALSSLDIQTLTSTAGSNYLNISSITHTNDGITIGTNVSANGSGANYIVADTLNFASLTAEQNGNNYIIANTSAQFGSITAGKIANDQGGGSSGNNYLYIDTSATTANFTTLSAIDGANYVHSQSSSGALTFTTISAINGSNYIGSVLTKNNGSIASKTDLNTNNLMSENSAITSGILEVTNGITSTGSGFNSLSFKAQATTTKTIIKSNANGTAISGNANIYLDVNASGINDGVSAITAYLQSSHTDNDYATLSNSAVISGNIVGSGTTNIKIIGTANTVNRTITNKSQIGILGNITNNNGTTNVVLQDTFFAPSQMIVTDDSSATSPSALSAPTTIGGTQAGNITTASGATTNIVTQFTQQSPAGNGYVLYNVNNQGMGVTNIVLQGDYQLGANINYGESYDGKVNIIFANRNSGNGSASFDASNTNIDNNQVLGITYIDGLKLTLSDKAIKAADGSDTSFIGTYGRYFTSTNNGNISTFTLDRNTTTDTINISGLILGSIVPLAESTTKTFNVNITENSAFVGSVVLPANLSGTSQVTLTMAQGSKLLTDNNAFYVKKLTLDKGITFSTEGLTASTFAQNNTIIDLATMGSNLGNVTTREEFRLFAVGSSTSGTDTGLQGNNALFRVYVNDDADQTKNTTTLGGQQANKVNGYFYSDRIIITDIGSETDSATTAQTHYLQIVTDANTDLKSIHYNTAQNGGTSNDKGGTAIAGNIAVATVKNGAAITSNDTRAIVEFGAQDTIQGFDQITSGLLALETDQYGMTGTGSTGWTTYFVNSMSTKGVTEERAEVSASTLAMNYDLYMANFNSLNKRMGELRNNDNSQGAWARIFNGSQTNDFGLGTKTNYTTFQAGYDYAIGMEGSNNYIGLAVSYSMSSSEVQTSLTQALDNSIVGFDNVKSSAVEVALYNSYVQDEGWYNDSIFKFSYIMSDFNILGQDTTYNTSNMAFILSDEFGYRFKLGNDKEWYIDPQAEVSLGYFDQTELKQTLGRSWLNTLADSVITMRSRFGSSFGYDFKKFTANKPIKASVYVGAFYEYDYVTGGDATLITNLGTESSTSGTIASDGRVVMNVGTNMTIKDNTRIYFDFESSFAGKINTDYQVNVGVRYSFGESNGYTPISAIKTKIAPLKVSGEKPQEQPSQENTSSEEKTDTNKTEQKAQ